MDLDDLYFYYISILLGSVFPGTVIVVVVMLTSYLPQITPFCFFKANEVEL